MKRLATVNQFSTKLKNYMNDTDLKQKHMKETLKSMAEKYFFYLFLGFQSALLLGISKQKSIKYLISCLSSKVDLNNPFEKEISSQSTEKVHWK